MSDLGEEKLDELLVDIVSSENPRQPSLPSLHGGDRIERSPSAGCSLQWTGRRLRPARWQRDDAWTRTTLTPCPAIELWSTPTPPCPVLPTAHLEALLQLDTAPAARLNIEAIHIVSEAGGAETVHRGPTGEAWIVDEASELVARVSAPVWRGA